MKKRVQVLLTGAELATDHELVGLEFRTPWVTVHYVEDGKPIDLHIPMAQVRTLRVYDKQEETNG